MFFSKKIWHQQTLPTYELAYVLNFAVFLGDPFLTQFLFYRSLSVIKKTLVSLLTYEVTKILPKMEPK